MRHSCPNAILHSWARLSVLILLGCASAAAPAPVHGEPVSEDRKASLDHLLRQDCGSCHGMTLQGGLGPALLPERFAGRDVDSIADMILYGNPEKAMPPWKDLLSQAEARYLAERIKNKGSN